ncbi:phage tail protein [Pseudoalteromonas sp. MMG022]|uniref:phage tail protein n=1 Tax=Pseudoalteromonas sp. MMG022 TaxID=2909978 RepID=UPI001F1E50F4|nr:phage tail protein [Pseudoalteromonas sp. MMG022]MCF6435213.1 phage tail protein [Pseudoalteromonas sp. MMG022]
MGILNKIFKLVGLDLEPKVEPKVRGVDFSVPATDDHIPVFYGETRRTTGTVIYRATNDTDGDEVKNELLHLIIVWGEANGCTVKQIYIDDEAITSAKFDDEDGRRWAYARHSHGSQYSDPILNRSGWEPSFNHPQGLLYSYVRLEMGAKDPIFNARPNITADIEQVSIYDVRTARQSACVSNPALQLYDYLTDSRYGKGLSSSQINVESFKTAATMCDLLVERYPGSPKAPLYTSNVRLDTSKSVKANCEMLLTAMRASLPVVNGRLTLALETDKAPVAWQANEQTIVSEITVTDASKKDRFNQVSVQYYDETRNGKLQDAVFPEKDSELDTLWLSEDNDIRLSKRIKIETLNNYYEALRIAEFIARKSREQLSIKFTARDDAALLAIGDIIRVTDEVLGFEQKPFVLSDMTLNSNGEVDLSMVEHQPSHYTWLPGARQPTIPDTIYNSRKPNPPSELQASVSEDHKLLIEWQSALEDFEYKVIRDGKVIKAGDTLLHEIELALDAGDYEFQVFAVNALGYRSNAASLLFSVDVPAVPSVEVTSVTPTSVVLYATTEGAGLLTNYEWQFAGEGEQRNVISQTLTVSSLLPNTRYEGQVRTLSPAGKSDWHTFSVTTAEQGTYERSVVLAFDLSQQPHWLGTGVSWQPENMVNQVRVSLIDLAAQTELAYQTLEVVLNDNGVMVAQLGDEQANLTDSELSIEFDGQQTSNLTVTATHEMQVVRQTFIVTGLSISEIRETQAHIAEIDALANTILEQALNTEQIFDADLTNTLLLEAKTDTTNAKVAEAAAAQADENLAVATRFSEVEAQLGVNEAYISNVEQALATTDQALATSISRVESQIDDNKAQIIGVEQALSTETQAIATKISEVKAQVGDNAANIVGVEQSLASTEEALSSKITQLTSTVADNQAQVQQYYITKADAQSAVSQAKTELQASVDLNRAYLDQTFYTQAQTDRAISLRENVVRSEFGESLSDFRDITYTKAQVDGAIALNSSNLTAKFDKNIGDLDDVYFSQADDNGALASFVRNVSVTTEQGSASVFQHMNAQATRLNDQGEEINSLSARAEIGVDANGNVTGMTITPGEVSFKAGVFNLLDNDNNSAVSFDTSSGKYQFNGHINATSGSFTGHVEATSGSFSGHVVANSGTFKGRVEATSGFFSGHVVANSGTFKGRVEATSGEISSVTLRSCTWDAGGSSTISASSGMLAIRRDGVINTRFLAEGEGFLRKLFIYNNGRSDEWGLNIEYHKNGIYVDPRVDDPDKAPKYWALYAKNGEVGPHTSAHETLLPKALTPEPGDILCDDELMHIASISNAICTAKISSTPMDVTARGIYTRRRNLTDSQPAGLQGFEEWEQLAYLYDVACINAGGEGAMNVCGEGGDLQTGDLICSSSMLGKGMRQPTQSEERYTIAQVRHNVTFDSPDQVKQVAVIYKRG